MNLDTIQKQVTERFYGDSVMYKGKVWNVKKVIMTPNNYDDVVFVQFVLIDLKNGRSDVCNYEIPEGKISEFLDLIGDDD